MPRKPNPKRNTTSKVERKSPSTKKISLNRSKKRSINHNAEQPSQHWADDLPRLISLAAVTLVAGLIAFWATQLNIGKFASTDAGQFPPGQGDNYSCSFSGNGGSARNEWGFSASTSSTCTQESLNNGWCTTVGQPTSHSYVYTLTATGPTTISATSGGSPTDNLVTGALGSNYGDYTMNAVLTKIDAYDVPGGGLNCGSVSFTYYQQPAITITPVTQSIAATTPSVQFTGHNANGATINRWDWYVHEIPEANNCPSVGADGARKQSSPTQNFSPPAQGNKKCVFVYASTQFADGGLWSDPAIGTLTLDTTGLTCANNTSVPNNPPINANPCAGQNSSGSGTYNTVGSGLCDGSTICQYNCWPQHSLVNGECIPEAGIDIEPVTISPAGSKANPILLGSAETDAFTVSAGADAVRYDWYHHDVSATGSCPTLFADNKRQNAGITELYGPPATTDLMRCIGVYASSSVASGGLWGGPAVSVVKLGATAAPASASISPTHADVQAGNLGTLLADSAGASTFKWYLVTDVANATTPCTQANFSFNAAEETGDTGSQAQFAPPSSVDLKNCVAVTAGNAQGWIASPSNYGYARVNRVTSGGAPTNLRISSPSNPDILITTPGEVKFITARADNGAVHFDWYSKMMPATANPTASDCPTSWDTSWNKVIDLTANASNENFAGPNTPAEMKCISVYASNDVGEGGQWTGPVRAVIYMEASGPVCGNGTVEPPETCDDGNQIDNDGCSAICQTEPVCGNGTVETGEQCDDGNALSGDGCSATCQTEAAVCGNGTVETGEQCDDGNTTSGDGCSATCTTEAGGSVCGDGTVDAGEQCDDGNTTSGDGCDANCQTEQLGDPTLSVTYTETRCIRHADSSSQYPGYDPGVFNSIPSSVIWCEGDLILNLTYGAGGPGIPDVVLEIEGPNTDDDNNIWEPLVWAERAEHQIHPNSGARNARTSSATATGSQVAWNAAVTDASGQADFIFHTRTLRTNTQPFTVKANFDATSRTSPACPPQCDPNLQNDTVIQFPPGNQYRVAGPRYVDDDGWIIVGYQTGSDCDDGVTTCSSGGVCGDGTIDSGETCDDGNTVSGDGCSSTCQTETTTCTPGPCTGTRVCGSTATGTNGCTSCTLPALPTPTINSFTASASTDAGNGTVTSTLAWTTSQATSASIDNGVGTVPVNGAQSVTTTPPTTYTLTASNNTCTATATAIVQSAACSQNPSIDTFTASPQSVPAAGGNSTFSWTTTNVSYVRIRDMAAGGSVIHDNLNADGSQVVAVTNPSHLYELVGVPTDSNCSRVRQQITITESTGSACGNGTLDPGEICDDNNLVDGDGCSATCNLEPPTGLACQNITQTTFDGVWVSQPLASSYRYRLFTGGTEVTSGDEPNTSTLHAFSGLSADTTYQFRLYPVNANGDLGEYANVSCRTLPVVAVAHTLTAVPATINLQSGVLTSTLTAQLSASYPFRTGQSDYSGYTIQFSFDAADTPPNGTMSNTTAITDASGAASITITAPTTQGVDLFRSYEPDLQTSANAVITYTNGPAANLTLNLIVPLEARLNAPGGEHGTHATDSLQVELYNSGLTTNPTILTDQTTNDAGTLLTTIQGESLIDGSTVRISLKTDQHQRRVISTTVNSNIISVNLGNPSTFVEMPGNNRQGKNFLPAGDVEGDDPAPNRDNAVNAIDYGAWIIDFQTNYGNSVCTMPAITPVSTDLDGNCYIGAEDLSLIIRNISTFGDTAPTP